MNTEKKIEQLFDSLRKVLFYVGHGKYNEFMSLEEVNSIKETLEKVLAVELEYKEVKTQNEIEDIYKRIEIYSTYSIRDFAQIKIDKV
jgi:hypothetical protein